MKYLISYDIADDKLRTQTLRSLRTDCNSACLYAMWIGRGRRRFGTCSSRCSPMRRRRSSCRVNSSARRSTIRLILDQTLWEWKGRSQHPGKDPVNALLNFGYAFLEREVRVSALMCGLDLRIGFFHANDGRKDALVFDLMEMFRQPVIDRLVLSLFNLKVMKPDDFERSKEECRLTDEARLTWCTRYGEYKEYGGKSPRDMILDRVRRFSTCIDRRK